VLAHKQVSLIPKLSDYFAEFPLLSCPVTPWLAQPAAPVIVLGTMHESWFPRSFHGVRELAKPCGLPSLIPLLLTISLQGIGLVEHRLRCLPYPKPSRAELALPRLSHADRNFNRFPFCAVGIAATLRIALLWAEEHGPETRVLCGVEDSRLDMLLLVPRYSWQAGPRDVTAPLLTSPSAPLPNSP